MVDVKALLEQWIEERPAYEEICRNVKRILERETRRQGVPCAVEARTKEPDSLVKKALRKGYPEPYRDIKDKAGVRVVCKYNQELQQVERIVREHFTVHETDNKTVSMDYDRLGYSGIHFEAELPDTEEEGGPKIGEPVCEIQLLTKAQSFWAEISHELVYKPAQNPPEHVKRIVYLQSALMEIFDNQMAQARREVRGTQGFQEALMLDELEKQFFRLVGSEYDRELSLQILDILKNLFNEEEIRTFGNLLSAFVDKNKELLAHLFYSYASDERRSPLLFQPEALVIFMCIERDMFKLEDTWTQTLPPELLQDLAEVWGKDVS